MNQAKFSNDRVLRWTLALQEYDYRLQDISGKDNIVADYLNRVID